MKNINNDKPASWWPIGAVIGCATLTGAFMLNSSGTSDEGAGPQSSADSNVSTVFPWAKASAQQENVLVVGDANIKSSSTTLKPVTESNKSDAQKLYANFLKNPNGSGRAETIISVYERLGRNFANATIIGLTPQSLHSLVTQNANNTAASTAPYLVTQLPQTAREGGLNPVDVIGHINSEMHTIRGAFLKIDNSYDRQKTIEGFTLQKIEEENSKTIIFIINQSLLAAKNKQITEDDKSSLMRLIEQGSGVLKQNVIVNSSAEVERFKQVLLQSGTVGLASPVPALAP